MRESTGFKTNLPVVGAEFRDRQAELKRLTDAVAHLRDGAPKWIALIGRRKVGKSSLLMELARQEAGRPPALVLFDAFEESPLTEECFRLLAIRSVDALLAASAGLSLERAAVDIAEWQAGLLKASLFADLPAELQGELLRLPDIEFSTAVLRQWLNLPERLAQALETTVLVAIDEFQALGDLSKKRGGFDPYPVMRSQWQRHRRVGYVVSGSSRSMMSALVSARDAPFFQHFDVMEIDAFPHDEAVNLFTEFSGVSAELAGHAANLVADHPFYLQLLGETLVRGPAPHDLGAVRAAFQELLFSRTGRLSMYFQREFDLLVGRSGYLAATLTALADGPLRTTELSKKIGAGTADTSTYLARLGDAVRTKDGVHFVDDPTFGLWLRWRGPRGAVVPMSVLGDAAEQAAAAYLARLGFDLVYQSRHSRGAFDLLAIRGAQQIGIQVRRRSRLPLRFSREAWARMDGDAQRYGWHWAVVHVDPSDVARVLDPTQARHGREVRLGNWAQVENVLVWANALLTRPSDV